MILSTVLGPVVLTFGQEDRTKLCLMSNLSPKLMSDSIPTIVNSKKLFSDSNKTFATYPMPNGYRGDNCVPMPNAYRGSNSVSMPNVYRGPIIRFHPADSAEHPLKKYEPEKEARSQGDQLRPR